MESGSFPILPRLAPCRAAGGEDADRGGRIVGFLIGVNGKDETAVTGVADRNPPLFRLTVIGIENGQHKWIVENGHGDLECDAVLA
jgi:hypothetical protein